MGLNGVSIDTGALTDQAAMLGAIAANFAPGADNLDQIARAIGKNDDGAETLGKRITQASDQWSAHRREMQERIAGLHTSVVTTVNAFEQLDADMATALREAASPRPSSNQPGTAGYIPPEVFR